MRLGIEPPNPAYVSLTARPQRTLVFVSELPGVAWLVTWAAALANQTPIWGGSANLLVPLQDGIADEELFWALTELHDPDACVVYAGSRADQEELDPTAYKEWRDLVDSQLANVQPGPERQLDRELDQPLAAWELPEVLARELVQRAAPFHSNGLPPTRGPLGGSPPWPLVNVLAFEPFPWEVLEPAASADPVERLLLTAEFGRFPSRTRAALLTPQSNVKAIAPGSRMELILWVYGGGQPSGLTPFAFSEVGCTWFTSGIPEPLPFTVVTGDHPWDFALAYALRRARGLAFWLPATLGFSNGERDYAIERLAYAGPQTGTPLIVTSVTDDAAAQRVASALSARTLPQVDVEAVGWRQALPRHSNRLLTAESLGVENAFFLDHDHTPQLSTPIPAEVTPRNVEDLRWVTDVAVRGWNVMRHQALGDGPLVADGGDSRATADGVAYSCPKWIVQRGIPLAHQVRRPNLVPLPLLDQLRVAAAAADWECQISHKGQFALAACALFGGFDELCAELRNPDVAYLLMAYLDGDRNAPGRLLDRRRYLRLSDVQALGLSGDAGELVNRFAELRVLVRGLVLKCDRCRYTAFYRPRDVDPSFACGRCSHEQRPAPEHWLGTLEPEWHYRLDEAVFQFLRQRGDLPAFVAYDLFAHSQEAVQIVPEIEFSRRNRDQPTEVEEEGERPREFDFAALRSGALYLGEAFTAARYARGRDDENRRLGYLAAIAAALNAHTVILATAAENLDQRTRTAAKSAFPAPRPNISFHEGASMLARPQRLLDASPDAS